MPTYAYGCDKCGFRFDRYQGFDDPPLTECPECGEDALRRLITPVGVVFKGSGFYSTDHRSPSGQGSSRRNDDSGPASKDGSGRDSSSKDSSGKDSSSKDSSSKDGPSRAGSSKDGSRKAASRKDGSSRDGSSKDGSRRDEAPKPSRETNPDSASSED